MDFSNRKCEIVSTGFELSCKRDDEKQQLHTTHNTQNIKILPYYTNTKNSNDNKAILFFNLPLNWEKDWNIIF